VLDPVPPTVQSMLSTGNVLVVAAVAVRAGLPGHAAAAAPGLGIWLGPVAVVDSRGCTPASLTLVYVSSPMGLQWYLSTSIDRVMVPV